MRETYEHFRIIGYRNYWCGIVFSGFHWWDSESKKCNLPLTVNGEEVVITNLAYAKTSDNSFKPLFGFYYYDSYKIDTEKERELAAVFGVRSIPTLLFCPMGENPQIAQGALPKEQLKEAIDKVLLKK